jgi:hypothetical protein
MRANARRDSIRLPMDDCHARVLDTQSFGADLRHDRFKSLAD